MSLRLTQGDENQWDSPIMVLKGLDVVFDCAVTAAADEGFRACVRTGFVSLVPQGRLNLAQDASPGLDLNGRPVPQGRLKIGHDAILDNFQPSQRDLIMFSW
jgi:hypothetical protein